MNNQVPKNLVQVIVATTLATDSEKEKPSIRKVSLSDILKLRRRRTTWTPDATQRVYESTESISNWNKWNNKDPIHVTPLFFLCTLSLWF